MDMDSLSDDELRQQLLANGVNPGPITASTRRIYIKKLAKIVASVPSNEPAYLAAALGDHDYMIPEEPIVQKNRDAVNAKPEPRHRKKKEQAQLTNEAQESDFEEGEESIRFLTEEEMLADMNRSRRSTAHPTKSTSLTRVLRFIIFIVAGIFLFFLFEGAVKGNKEHI